METLIELLKKTLADSFSLYLKSHNYHWNVTGKDFVQLHGFFGDLYEEVHGSIDQTAEHIRTLGVYVPGSYKRFSELTEIDDELAVPPSDKMIENLIADNEIVLKTLNIALKFANKEDKQGISNFLADRIDVHEKHAWMLKSIRGN